MRICYSTITKKDGLRISKKFALEKLGALDFIDDVTGLIDCGESERSFREIYPTEVELKKENLSYLEGSFLDLMITVKDKKIFTKLFNKMESFQFSLVI